MSAGRCHRLALSSSARDPVYRLSRPESPRHPASTLRGTGSRLPSGAHLRPPAQSGPAARYPGLVAHSSPRHCRRRRRVRRRGGCRRHEQAVRWRSARRRPLPPARYARRRHGAAGESGGGRRGSPRAGLGLRLRRRARSGTRSEASSGAARCGLAGWVAAIPLLVCQEGQETGGAGPLVCQQGKKARRWCWSRDQEGQVLVQVLVRTGRVLVQVLVRVLVRRPGRTSTAGRRVGAMRGPVADTTAPGVEPSPLAESDPRTLRPSAPRELSRRCGYGARRRGAAGGGGQPCSLVSCVPALCGACRAGCSILGVSGRAAPVAAERTRIAHAP